MQGFSYLFDAEYPPSEIFLKGPTTSEFFLKEGMPTSEAFLVENRRPPSATKVYDYIGGSRSTNFVIGGRANVVGDVWYSSTVFIEFSGLRGPLLVFQQTFLCRVKFKIC